MSFILSKVFWFLAAPDNLLFLVLLAGAALLFTRFRRAGRGLVAAGALAGLFVFVLPLGDWLLQPLENRFPSPPAPAVVHGVVVLGGSQSPQLTQARGQPSLNEAAERLIETVALARRYPSARVVFTGGSGNLLEQNARETETTRLVFEELGLADDRVLYEPESRNTWENALFSLRLVQPRPDETWLLVTSAAHMPRSVGVFRKAGWRVIPWPVDYETLPAGVEVGAPSFQGRLRKLDAAVREWIGLAAYRLMGRTDAFFPSP